MQVQTIEEFLWGPERDEKKGIRPKLEQAIEGSKKAGVERIEVEIRTTPNGTSSSRSEGSKVFRIQDPLDQVIEALRRELESSPGETFHGELRLNFRACGSSQTHLGSFTRQMRPALSAQLTATDKQPSGELKLVIENAIRPLVDQMVRLGDSSVRMVEAAAKLVEAHKPAATSYGDPKSALIGNLLQGALGVARADAAGPSGSGAPAGPQLVQTGEPPPPPGVSSAPPRVSESAPAAPQAALPGPSAVDEAAVRAFLKDNPQKAMALGQEMLAEHGLTVVPA